MPSKHTQVLPHRETTPVPPLPTIPQPLPALKYLFGCYFHQDWNLDYSAAEEAIQDYLAASQKVELTEAIKEINWLREWLRQAQLSDKDISTLLLEQLHLNYIPVPKDAASYNEWLFYLRELLEKGKSNIIKEVE